MFLKRIKWSVVALFFSVSVFSQEKNQQFSFFEPMDSLHSFRLGLGIGLTAINYTGFSIALYQTWYKQYPQEGFHFFNDWGEWNNMDKVGHIYSAYFQSAIFYKGAKWTGLSEDKSLLAGAICGGLFQSTIEVMDGFSTEWGFSLTDFGANALGIGAFLAQQKAWGEQKILIKQSSQFNGHDNSVISSINSPVEITLQNRADDLFGSSLPERFLKDYNRQTYWVSTSFNSLLPDAGLPSWLNLAVGYGSENMYGGYDNSWKQDGSRFQLSEVLYPRYRQYYLSLDVDFNRIKTDSHFLKTLFSLLNIFKAPSPTLEVTSHGEVQFHLLFF